MPNLLFKTDWKWAERGMFVHEFKKGETKEVSEECARAALDDGVAEETGKTEKKSHDAGVKSQGEPASAGQTGAATPASSSPAVQASAKKISATPKAKKLKS